MTRYLRVALVLALGMLLFTSSAFAATYVLTAGRWGAAQDKAVAAAGGTVTFSHAGTGIGVAESQSPDFLAKIQKAGGFTSAAEDVMVEWQPQVQTFDAGEAGVTPGDETFAALQWAPAAVEAQGAWDAGFTGAGVRVAVLDGGIHNTHIDLVGRVDTAASASMVPGYAYNNDTGTFWHGTHVAGIIAAKDNGIGTVGIAPDATIIGVKVLHSGSGSFTWIIRGIIYAATPLSEGGAGAEIINMSLGAVFPKTAAGTLIGALNKAVNYAASQGVLVVVAAGNDGIDFGQARNYISVPAQSGTGIAVSATGPLGFAKGATNYRRISSYTNYGEDIVSVAGPGGDFAYEGNDLCTLPRYPAGSITNYCWVFDMVMSTSRGSGASVSSYSWAAGTSMAAPAVAAVAALVKQAHPAISLGALEAKLLGSADDEGKVGHDQFYGRGFVNARRAVE